MSEIYQDTLYGQILPAGWDGEDVSDLILLVDGEEECILEKNEFSKILTNYIDRWITVQGLVTENDEEISIKVQSYTLEDEMNFGEEDAW